MHGDLRPALRRGIRSSGLDTADDAALHVRCWPLDDLVINSDVRFAPKAEVPKKLSDIVVASGTPPISTMANMTRTSAGASRPIPPDNSNGPEAEVMNLQRAQ